MAGYVDNLLVRAVNGDDDDVGYGEVMRVSGRGGGAGMAQGMPGSAPPSVPFGRSTRSLLRRAPLGLPAASVPANSSLPFVSQQLSRVFHPDRLLIIPSAPGLTIDSIRIGDEEQTATAGAPVELYGANALTDTLPDNFTPIQTGTTVTVTLRNTTGAAIDVTLGMKGGVER